MHFVAYFIYYLFVIKVHLWGPRLGACPLERIRNSYLRFSFFLCAVTTFFLWAWRCWCVDATFVWFEERIIMSDRKKKMRFRAVSHTYTPRIPRTGMFMFIIIIVSIKTLFTCGPINLSTIWPFSLLSYCPPPKKNLIWWQIFDQTSSPLHFTFDQK